MKKRLPKHRRRPKRITGPKRWAFLIDMEFEKPVHADDAQDGKGLYVYGFQPVQHKRFPKRKDKDGRANQRTGYYYAYEGANSCAAPSGGGMTPTHALMQAIICDVGFIYCMIDGTRFSSELDDPQPERVRKANVILGQGIRRPDIRASARQCSIKNMNEGALDIEIAVTNPIDTFTRHSDLLKEGRPCIEIIVPRDSRLEENIDDLEEALRRTLHAGVLEARWIVDPHACAGRLCSLADIEGEMKRWLSSSRIEERRLEEVVSSCDRRAAERSVNSSGEAEREHAILRKIQNEEAEVLRYARMRDGEDFGQMSFLQTIIEWVFPVLRDSRLNSKVERWNAMRAQVQSKYANARTGILSRLEKLERVDRQAREVVDRERLLLERERSEAAALLSAERHRKERLCDVLSKITDLRQKRIETLLITPGHDVPWTVEFEHRRWC